jgi:hypothetical protein
MFAFLFFFRIASTTYLRDSTTRASDSLATMVCLTCTWCQACFSQLLCSNGALADLVNDVVDVLAAIAGADGVAEADLEAA